MEKGNSLFPLPSGALLSFRRVPLVMGILNLTPDSFYPGSRVWGLEQAVERGRKMIEEGAEILDVGGESTRPGSDYVGAEEEIRRIIPLIEALRRESAIPISVDTRKGRVAKAALAAGADIINDISGLRDDPENAGAAIESGAPVIIMHCQGTPKTMQENPFYADPIKEISQELSFLASRAETLGVKREKIILDPGIGFGKRQKDNLLILKHLSVFVDLGYPLLIGLSRKSFLGNITGKAVDERLIGSLAANCAAALKGAAILRVHDVKETAEALKVLAAIEDAE